MKPIEKIENEFVGDVQFQVYAYEDQYKMERKL